MNDGCGISGGLGADISVNPPRIDRSSSGTSMEDGRGKMEEDFDVRWKKEDGRRIRWKMEEGRWKM